MTISVCLLTLIVPQLAYIGLNTTYAIKLCQRKAQMCALPLFFDRDLELNLMTLRLKGDLCILKMYPDTENEAVSLSPSKLIA